MSNLLEEKLGLNVNFKEKDNGILSGYFHNHKMTRIEIRNYMHSHNVETINQNTLYNFFGPNIYDKVEGCEHYFTHEILKSPFEIDKVYVALEAAFTFLGPNTGELVYGENYFQTFMFNYEKLGFSKLDDSVQIMFIVALLELGFKYGLDPNFKCTIEGNTIWHHLFLCIMNFKVLEGVFNLLDKKKIDSCNKINIYNSNFDGVVPFRYLNLKLTNKYDLYYRYSCDQYTVNHSKTKIACIYFNSLSEEETKKKVDELYYSLQVKYKAIDKSYLIYPNFVDIDPLLLRFLINEELLHSREMESGGICYDVGNKFNLSGYGTLGCYLDFYWRVYKKYRYNREGEESIKSLKKILKKA